MAERKKYVDFKLLLSNKIINLLNMIILQLPGAELEKLIS